jgi:hypothetical protein
MNRPGAEHSRIKEEIAGNKTVFVHTLCGSSFSEGRSARIAHIRYVPYNDGRFAKSVTICSLFVPVCALYF